MSSPAVLDDFEILSDVINCGTPDFDADAARAVLCLGFSDSQLVELADRHNRGQLSTVEHEQMESYRRVGNFLALPHARARLSLKHAAQAPR